MFPRCVFYFRQQLCGPLGRYKSFTINQTPEVWHKSGYLCLKPLASWTTDLHRRIAFMSLWLKEGPPKSFWLPGFFFPQGFMTGTHAACVRA
jgi:dynein heavy chain